MNDDRTTPGALDCAACTAVPRSVAGLCLGPCSEIGEREAGTSRAAAPADTGHEARQGYLYDYRGVPVIALESGACVRVLRVSSSCALDRLASAADLLPLPMVYYNGEVPV